MGGFSIVILNWNGKKFLSDCLSSVFDTDHSDYEVIFVDNGSTDGSVEYVRKFFGSHHNLIIAQNKENYGTSKGFNVGLEQSSKEFVVFLNNDTRVDPAWLKELDSLFSVDNRIGAIQSLLVKSGTDQVQQGGLYLSFYAIGRALLCEYHLDEVSRLPPLEIGAAGCAFAVRRSVLEHVGSFDESFFFFFEDIDLTWRIKLAGYKLMLCPRSVVYHYGHGSWSQPDIKNRIFNSVEGRKNSLKTIIKNMSSGKLLAALPQSIVFYLIESAYQMDIAGIYGLFGAILWNLRNLGSTWKQRDIVQHDLRCLSDREIFDRWTVI